MLARPPSIQTDPSPLAGPHEASTPRDVAHHPAVLEPKTSGRRRHRNFIIATTNESQGKPFAKAELGLGGGIADDGDDDDGDDHDDDHDDDHETYKLHDDEDDDNGENYLIGQCCETLSSPALAWLGSYRKSLRDDTGGRMVGRRSDGVAGPSRRE